MPISPVCCRLQGASGGASSPGSARDATGLGRPSLKFTLSRKGLKGVLPSVNQALKKADRPVKAVLEGSALALVGAPGDIESALEAVTAKLPDMVGLGLIRSDGTGGSEPQH